MNKVMLLIGNYDKQTAILSLHRTGSYKLKKNWKRNPGELGIISLGELGHFQILHDEIFLESDSGQRRVLKKQKHKSYKVSESAEIGENQPDYSLQEWVFEEEKD
ncbi:MAG: hypothetical protein AB1847_16210 [bacterium]